jgi:hypothetical protein
MNNQQVIGSAIINTKSNFRNLNGTIQQVIEYIPNKRVSCKIWAEDVQKFITADFSPNECTFL